jgi:hypothetical protein
VTSLAFKGEGTPAGVTAAWIVTEPVERAVTVLEQLQPTTEPFLFAVLHSSGSFLQARETGVKSTAASNLDIAAFVDWINAYSAEQKRSDRVPLVNGRRWRLTTRQFRRTLAWFIARRRGGVIAGAIQYRHHGVQMFEGYAGTSDSGFRAEVQAERAITRSDKLVDIVDHSHNKLTGPAAAEAETRLAEYVRHAHFRGKVIATIVRTHQHAAGAAKRARDRRSQGRTSHRPVPRRPDHQNPHPGRRPRPVPGLADHPRPERRHPPTDPTAEPGPGPASSRAAASATGVAGRRQGVLLTGEPESSPRQTHHYRHPRTQRPDRQPEAQRPQRRPPGQLRPGRRQGP